MYLKRTIDIVVSALMLLVALPIFLIIAVAIVLDSGFPVLYSQRRVGRQFQEFELLKFRSMQVCNGGSPITVKGDKRITRVGRILRIAKLDEIPQLWNVLWGDMSLVGPRPELPEYVNLFRDRYKRVLAVRPGVTDLASICFRNEEEILSRSQEPLRNYVEAVLPIKLDLADEYIRKRSLWLDLQILAKTLIVVLRFV